MIPGKNDEMAFFFLSSLWTILRLDGGEKLKEEWTLNQRFACFEVEGEICGNDNG